MTTSTEKSFPEGTAIIYCQGAYNTTYGKTAHGLVRFSQRYRIAGVVDDLYAGEDAGDVLDGRPNNIPIFDTIDAAIEDAKDTKHPATHLVVGIAPDGGRLGPEARADVIRGIKAGLNVDCGLHSFLSEDAELTALARQQGVKLRDIRKPPPRDQLHFFNDKIENVKSLKIAVLGTDSAVGKRTTAWQLVQGFQAAGATAEMIGTGQTAWLQGARYGILLDALVNDFVSGEIEHVIWQAWEDARPAVMVLEGQGSLMNPAYPGGFEILAAGRPDVIVLQHAPARQDYDGFPGYPIQALPQQIQAIEMISGKPVVAVTINHEGLHGDRLQGARVDIFRETGRPAFDVLIDGSGGLIKLLWPLITQNLERHWA